jgi:nicotinamide mononucleotide (NMN) deamidase PncC
VGLVWLAVASEAETRAVRHQFPGDREAVTRAAVDEALRLLASAL